MRADELDVDGLEAICHGDDQAIVVALDVEEHAIVANKADARVVILDVAGCGPSGVFCLVVLGLESLFGIRVAYPKVP